MTDRTQLALVAVLLPALAAVILGIAPRRTLAGVARVAALASGGVGLALAGWALACPDQGEAGRWIVVDAPAGLFVAAISVVGALAVVASPGWLRLSHGAIVRPERRDRAYWFALHIFWATLVAVPLVGNLGAAWLLVEATTATSAILVGFSGRPRALEAAWKYLILTSLGLGVALLGIVLLAAGAPESGLDALTWDALATFEGGRDSALVAFVLVVAGFAAKVGLAPVHNWLPDAHSEAPPPVSALLSGALLPAVLLVVWRASDGLAPVVGQGTVQGVLIGFGLVSLAVSVPFLWRALPWKRLLAYSSLEHMGVLALGIGLASPLALAGVVIHVLGHAVAKALGFLSATPLLVARPRAADQQLGDVARTEPVLGTAMGVSLGALSGLPPSPLFASEVLIVAGAFQAGHPVVGVVAAVALALSFLGLAHALLEVLFGRPTGGTERHAPGRRALAALTVLAVVLLLALTAVAPFLAERDLVRVLTGGIA